MKPEAIPEIPDHITPEMHARFAAEAYNTVRGLPHAGRPTDSRAAAESAALEAFRTVLAGITMAVTTVVLAAGLVIIWTTAPSLAYVLVLVAGACGLGWLVYYWVLAGAGPAARR